MKKNLFNDNGLLSSIKLLFRKMRISERSYINFLSNSYPDGHPAAGWQQGAISSNLYLIVLYSCQQRRDVLIKYLLITFHSVSDLPPS